METIDDYLEALASAAPTPGGGSAATIVGAMAASLVGMVARITLANVKFADHAAHAEKIIGAADAIRLDFLTARAEDERAYIAVVDAMSLPKTNDAEKALRATRLQDALASAAAAPLRAAQLSLSVLAQSLHARSFGNTNLMSDVECAAYFSRACLLASAANVRVNHRYMKDVDLVASQKEALHKIELAFTDFYKPFE